MYLQKYGNKQKKSEKNNYFFCRQIEGHWKKEEDPYLESNLEPPLVTGTAPRIQIR